MQRRLQTYAEESIRGCCVNKVSQLLHMTCHNHIVLTSPFTFSIKYNIVVGTGSAGSRRLPQRDCAHFIIFCSGATVKNCVCSLSLYVSLNVKRVNPDGLKNPQQLQPFFITYSCSVSASFYSLQVRSNLTTPQKHSATCHLSNAMQFILWPLILAFAK